MKVWLIQANEPIPIVDKNQRLFRTGLLAEQLSNGGHDVTWFATTFDHYTKKQRFEKNEVVGVNKNFRLNLIWAPAYKKNISIKRIINHSYMAKEFEKLIKMLDEPDLIYVSFPTIEFAEAAIKYGEEKKIKVIVDVRDMWPDIFKHNLGGLLGNLAYPYIKIMDSKTKNILRKAFAINSISSEALEWSLKKANRKIQTYDKSYFIGYTRNEKNIISTPSINLPKEKLIISFFGTINNQFNFELLTNVARELIHDDIAFVICGDGPQMNYLKELANEINNMYLVGWVEHDTIDYVLANSFMGFAPYKNTFDFQMGVSNKFGEYLSNSLPVIVTCEGAMENLINEYECGIMSMDKGEITNYIRNIKNDKTKYKKICESANKLFSDKLDAKLIYKDLAEYIEIVGGLE